MLKHAYQLYGTDYDDVLKPNTENKSRELKDINLTSPVKPFKGYKKR